MQLSSTKQIVRGKRNTIYTVNLDTLFTWYPGDYPRVCESCPKGQEYHTCAPIELQWIYVLDIVECDDRYTDIYKSVKKQGLVGALRGKVTKDDHVVLLDGHHRVRVALEMSMGELPVYIGAKTTPIQDLVAADSGWWHKSHEPWTTITGK